MASKDIKFEHINYKISYELVNANKEKCIIFLHGWGANKLVMKNAFSSLFDDFKLVFIDLPGFGKSSIQKSLNSYEYALIVREFLQTLNLDIDCIVGHSFGGKIATLLKPNHLVLLSSAGILKQKSLKVRLKIKLFKVLKLFGFGKFYRIFATKDVDGLSDVMYESLKKVVDEDFSKEFKTFKGEALIFWGKEDEATPLKSGETIHEFIKNSNFYPLDGDHFFFLKHSSFIAKTIKEKLC